MSAYATSMPPYVSPCSYWVDASEGSTPAAAGAAGAAQQPANTETSCQEQQPPGAGLLRRLWAGVWTGVTGLISRLGVLGAQKLVTQAGVALNGAGLNGAPLQGVVTTALAVGTGGLDSRALGKQLAGVRQDCVKVGEPGL
jgi:hypothetical protein